MWIADGDDYVRKSAPSGGGTSRKEARTGQILNGVAIVGGTNAMRMAVGEFGHAVRGTSPRKKKTWTVKPATQGIKITPNESKFAPLGRALKKIPGAKKIAAHPKTASIGLATAALGLHAAELGGDFMAANQWKKSLDQTKDQNNVHKSLPTHAIHKLHPEYYGKMRVTGMIGKHHFSVIDRHDTRRMFHRDALTFLGGPSKRVKTPKAPIQQQLPFGKSMPKTVPDLASSVLPGSSVRAYDHSNKHKLRAGAGNVSAKSVGGGAGAAVGVGLAAVAGKKLKPLQTATKISHGGIKIGTKKVLKPRRMTISRDMKRGWVQSSIVGTAGGVGSGYAGNSQLKHVQRNKYYDYGR